MSEATAVDFERRVLQSKHRHVLIHDATGDTNEFPFRALAELRDPQAIGGLAIEHRQRTRDLESGRRTEARAFGHSAVDENIEGSHDVSGADQLLRHADDV